MLQALAIWDAYIEKQHFFTAHLFCCFTIIIKREDFAKHYPCCYPYKWNQSVILWATNFWLLRIASWNWMKLKKLNHIFFHLWRHWAIQFYCWVKMSHKIWPVKKLNHISTSGEWVNKFLPQNKFSHMFLLLEKLSHKQLSEETEPEGF